MNPPERCPKCNSNFIYDDWGEPACICGKRFYPDPLPFMNSKIRTTEIYREAGLKAWRTRQAKMKLEGLIHV